LKKTCTYLEAAIANGTAPSTWSPGTTANWSCWWRNLMTGDKPNPDQFEIGQGQANTKIIITGRNCSYDPDDLASAASIAKDYNGGGKNDWFLPSRKELNALCLEFFNDPNSEYAGNVWSEYQLDGCRGRQSDVTGTANETQWRFAAVRYWSSSEGSQDYAMTQDFNSGTQGSQRKSFRFSVRPVRAF
jgi:hypothetical protein